jgi:hypothetical protein
MGDKFKEDLEFFLKNLRPVLWMVVGLIFLGWGAWALWKLSKKGKEDLDSEVDSVLENGTTREPKLQATATQTASGQPPLGQAHSLKETG